MALSIGNSAGAQEPIVWTALPETQIEGGLREKGLQSESSARCRIQVSSAQTDQRRVFSATEIMDLDLRVVLGSQEAGEHILRVKVNTPKGHLYQTLTTPFTTDAMRGANTREIDGFPRPLAVQVAQSVTVDGTARQTVVVQLPVAGTPIVHSSLYGRWTAAAFIDDRTEPCGRPRAFVVEP